MENSRCSLSSTCPFVQKAAKRIETLEHENYAQDDALEAIAMYVYEKAPDKPATPDDVQQKVLEYIRELKQLYGCAVLRLQELGEKTVPLK